MSTTYTGNEANITPRATVTITEPADGDPRNAASVNTALSRIADLLQHLEQRAALLNQTNAFTGVTTFTAPATNNPGLATQGAGTGAGIVSTGGASNGYGIIAGGVGTGPGGQFSGGAANAWGAIGIGNGTGYGVVGTGGTSGAGMLGQPGTAATASTPQTAFLAGGGYYGFSGGIANPNSNVAFTNTITPTNIAKAWAVINWSNANPTTANVLSGFNVTAVSASAGVVTLTMGGSAVSGWAALAGSTTAPGYGLYPDVLTAGMFKVANGAGTNIDFTTTSGRLHVVLFYNQ